MKAVEALLRCDFPDREIVWTSRGTAALFVALQIVRERQKKREVILPATVCPSVALAVMYAGLSPVFCDVEPETFCVSSRTLRPHLTDDTCAVIAVHLFGKSAPIIEIQQLLTNTSIALIEDCAQSLGGMYGDLNHGSFGEFSIISFSEKKILGGDCGALLVEDREVARRARELESALPLSLRPSVRGEMGRSFRDLTTGAYDLLRAREFDGQLDVLTRYAEYYRPLFLGRLVVTEDQWICLDEAYGQLRESRRQRQERYQIYKKELLPEASYVRFDEREMIWRLPMLLPTHAAQLHVIKTLRAGGVLASNHYFPVSALCGRATGETAKEIGLRALNVWVDSKADLEKLPWACGEINRAFAP